MNEASEAIARSGSRNRTYLETYFSGAPEELMNAFRRVNIRKGEIFITEGTRVDWVYVLLRGRVTAVDYRVREMVYGFTEFRPVEIFGVMEILGEITQYGTTLAAATDCVCLKVQSAPFAAWIMHDTAAMQMETKNIIGYMLDQARKERLYIMLPATGRISLILKNLYENYGRNGTYGFYMGRKDFSQMAGLSERTVTRSLKELEEEGCISREGRRIFIDSRQYLLIRRKVEALMSDGMEE